jgi:hypothetical protein
MMMMMAPIASYYSIDSFVMNRYRLLCFHPVRFRSPALLICRYGKPLHFSPYYSRWSYTKFFSDYNSHLSYNNFCITLNIFSVLLKPRHIQFIHTFGVVSRRSVLSSNSAVDIAPTQSAVDNIWPHWTHQPRQGLFVVDRLRPYPAVLSMFLLQYFV